MSNSIALISLIILIACIAIGFVLKKNVGLIAILAAAIFGSVAGYSDSAAGCSADSCSGCCSADSGCS